MKLVVWEIRVILLGSCNETITTFTIIKIKALGLIHLMSEELQDYNFNLAKEFVHRTCLFLIKIQVEIESSNTFIATHVYQVHTIYQGAFFYPPPLFPSSVLWTYKLTEVNTSRPAPPHCPDSRALRMAASSIMPPRATLITFTPFLHFPNTASFMRSTTYIAEFRIRNTCFSHLSKKLKLKRRH